MCNGASWARCRHCTLATAAAEPPGTGCGSQHTDDDPDKRSTRGPGRRGMHRPPLVLNLAWAVVALPPRAQAEYCPTTMHNHECVCCVRASGQSVVRGAAVDAGEA